METSIKMLDDRTDHATKKMLANVVAKKRKFDGLKSRHQLSIMVFLLVATIYFLYIFNSVIEPHAYSMYEVFSVYVASSINLYGLAATAGLFGLMNLLKNKKEKAESEFHALRCEIIDKSKDLWKKEDEWKNRHLVFEMMKDLYDINLYHENK